MGTARCCSVGCAVLPSLAAFLCPQVFPLRQRGHQPPPQWLPRSPQPSGPKPSAVIQAPGDSRGPVCAGDDGGGLPASPLSLTAVWSQCDRNCCHYDCIFQGEGQTRVTWRPSPSFLDAKKKGAWGTWGRGGPGGVGEKLKSRPSEGKGWERAPWNLTASLPQFLPHRTLVCGDRAGTITAQGLWGWGRGGATAKWPELEKAAFGS